MFATIMFFAQDHCCNTNFHHIISQLSFEIFHKVLSILIMYHGNSQDSLLYLFRRFFTFQTNKTYQMKISINNYKTKLENTWRFIKAFNVRNQF